MPSRPHSRFCVGVMLVRELNSSEGTDAFERAIGRMTKRSMEKRR